MARAGKSDTSSAFATRRFQVALKIVKGKFLCQFTGNPQLYRQLYDLADHSLIEQVFNVSTRSGKLTHKRYLEWDRSSQISALKADC